MRIQVSFTIRPPGGSEAAVETILDFAKPPEMTTEVEKALQQAGFAHIERVRRVLILPPGN